MNILSSAATVLKPWKDAFSNSTSISTTVITVHIIALLFAGGLAIAADRTTLRAFRATSEARAAHLEELAAVHRPVLIALTLLFVSGVLLFTSDIETFATSPLFWAKMTLIVLLLVNGAVLQRTETGLRAASAGGDVTSPLWRRLRASSYASLTLWTLTAIAGVVLANVS
jgi:hypothetical protein